MYLQNLQMLLQAKLQSENGMSDVAGGGVVDNMADDGKVMYERDRGGYNQYNDLSDSGF